MKKLIANGNFRLTIIFIFMCIIILVCIAKPFVFNFNDTVYTITVTDKERVNNAKSSKYLIFGEDKDGKSYVFENTDTWLRGKFNSSDFYGNLKVGQEYELVVVGYRIPLFSYYENIISYKEI